MRAVELLREHPAVAEAESEADGARVRLHPGSTTGSGQLLAYLRRTLPEPELPAHIRCLRDDGDDPVDGSLRDQIAHSWRTELGTDPAAGERFVESGGDSLAAARFVHSLAEVLGRSISLSEAMPLLLQHRFSELVPALARLGREEPPAPGVAERPVENTETEGSAGAAELRFAPFSLTDQQQAYVLGRDRLFASGELPCHTYLEFDGVDLDLDRFRAAWRRLVLRHDALRLRIDGQAMTQRVDRPIERDLVEVLDLRGTDEAAALVELRERLAHRIAPLDGPFVDVVVAILGGGRQRICIGVDALVADLGSSAVLFAELAVLYRDPEVALPVLEWSFRENVLAELAAADSERYRRDRDYWHRRIDTLPEAPELPLAADPATLTGPRFTNRAARLDPQCWGSLRKLAARESITPSALLATAYAEVIGLWARVPRFTLNLPSFNRRPQHRDVDRVVGEFASFTLVEVDLAATETFFERARRLQRQLWQDLAHQHYGGMAVLREYIRRRRLHGRAVMPIVFTGATMLGVDPATLLDGTFTRGYRLSKTPQVWIDLIVEEQAGALLLNWDALEALFPAGLMEDMATGLVDLLTRLADGHADPQPAVPPAQLALFDRVAGEKREIPEGGAAASFDRHACAEPEGTAVIAADRELSRGQLRVEARLLGRRLLGLGAGRQAPVAVSLSRGWRPVVAAYGAQYAGAAYLPIDPQTPAERLRQLLRQSGARVLITDQSPTKLGIADHDALEILGIEAVDPANGDPVQLPTLPTPGAGDLCFLLPTSGTTGRPKLAMIEHRAVVNCLTETARTFGIGPGDRSFALTALHHDMSAFDLFGVLGAGGSIVLPGSGRDPWQWARQIERHGVTLWNSVPASLEMLLESDLGASDLRLAFCGGDWVRPALVRKFSDRAPGARFVSVGGPTETTIWNIWHPVQELSTEATAIPYGRAIANARYHVLDERGRQRPVGVVGELCCTGQTLARGYLGDPERTGQSFTRHPQTAEPMYRTGDLGRFRADGEIEFAGRADQRLKVRGRRVEPGEIEQAILAHPEVAAVSVTGLPDRDGIGHRGLVAHIAPAVPAGLQQWLTSRLIPHLIPGVFVGVRRMPLTANGKLDRSALPMPEDPELVTAPPRGALETVLAEIWARLLGVERVGRDDDFFALGGDSLIATRLIAAVREAIPGSQPGIRALFRTPHVAGLAETLGDRARLERVARLRLEVARMSAEQVERRLAEGLR